jgi:ethanolamine ammonia-lyase large subunit
LEESVPHAFMVIGQTLPEFWSVTPADGEELFSRLRRTTGRVHRDDLARVLAAANAFKEGDAAIGISAPDDAGRSLARRLLSATRVGEFEDHVLFDTPLFGDTLSALLLGSLDPVGMHQDSTDTFDKLRRFLLDGSGSEIALDSQHWSSEVIACVVKLMSNDELTLVSAKLCRRLPGSEIGAATQLGARLQPNSPTDHPDDIRWQVFCGWSYGVGDVLLGTNPVSSDPESVLRVERTLQEIIETFGLTDVLPHCVLAHIDVQAEVERMAPGSTALWFQSIAGSDAANRTFDVTVERMVQHAQSRTGPFALYFETGQGADFTNGHGRGVDMVIHESRKYGFARALTGVVERARRLGFLRNTDITEPAVAPDWQGENRSSTSGIARISNAESRDATAGCTTPPWVIVNDVAGFIGPEVFRTKEQLVRCCLEDLVMGKLHGLTIGLDVCATLHMEISLDDLDWCLEQLIPARPAYLMALPTKVDPMLGYLTTGFQDHVRLREQFGLRVNPPMQAFFESIGAMNAEGGPGSHFGDPVHVYVAYQRRRGDTRSHDAIRADGRRELEAVRARGVFIAEGYGERAGDLSPVLDKQIRHVYDDAKLAFWATLSAAFVESVSNAVLLETQSVSREDYILHPTTGEALSAASRARVDALRESHGGVVDVQLVVSDGLNALAIMEPEQLSAFLDTLRAGLAADGWRVAPEIIVVRSGRVRVGYQIGTQLFGGSDARCALVHVIGERPGTGHHTFSAYVTVAPGAVWGTSGRVDHDITRVVSGMARTATKPAVGAGEVVRMLAASRRNGTEPL